MYIPPPPGYRSNAVQPPKKRDGGGGLTFGTVVKGALLVGGIWGIAAIISNAYKTTAEARKLIRG